MNFRTIATFCLAALTMALVSCNSCSNNKTTKEQNDNLQLEQTPRMELSRQDTDEVRNLSETYLQKIVDGNIDGAVGMLYYLNKDHKLQALPADLKKKELQSMGLFKTYGYNIDFIKFNREIDSEVKFTLIIQNPKETQNPATIGGMFRPVREGGKWYLTLSNSRTDTVSSDLDH